MKGDKFENGVFWELYKDLERQFENFLEYVPYVPENENVYSFKLLNLILSIGGHIDSAFKEMARYSKFFTNDNCKKILRLLKESEENIKKGKAPKTVPIWLPLKAFEKEYGLSKRKVIFKRFARTEREEVTPFQPYNPNTKAPEWWEIYNGLKHDVSINIQNGNLRNTLHALASVFLLNVIHIPAILRLYDCGILKIQVPFTAGLARYALTQVSRNTLQDIVEKKQSFTGFVETSLFIYDYAR